MPIIDLTKDPNDTKRTATPQGLTAAEHPELAGTIVYDDVIHMAASTTEQDPVGWDYVGISPVTLFGQLQRRVVHSTITGLYSFYYRLSIDPTSVAHVYELIVYPAMGSQIEADYRIDGLGDFAPTSVSAGLPDPYGDFDGYPPEMVFTFDRLMPGQSSKFLLITPSPKSHPDGSVDFAHSGALGFSPTGGTVALKINSSLLPIGFKFPAPIIAAPHPIHPPPHHPTPWGPPTEQHLAGEKYRSGRDR